MIDVNAFISWVIQGKHARSLGAWLWEPGRVVLGVGIAIGVPFWIATLWPGSVPALKYFGVLLQFGGVGFLVWDALERARMSKASLKAWFWDWIGRLPYGRVVTGSINSMSAAIEVRGSGNVTFKLERVEGRSLEQRIADLESLTESQGNQITEHGKAFGEAINKITDEIKAERKAREGLKSEVSHDLGEVKTYTLGDVRLDIIGIAWVIVGVFLGGFPDEDIQCFSLWMTEPVWSCQFKKPW